MSLPRKLRLTINREVLWRLRKEGKTIQTPLLSAKYYPSDQGKGARFGVVIGTAVDKRATTRNRIKRTIYEAILGSLPKQAGTDMIIYPKKGIINSDKQRVEEETKNLLKSIK